MLRLVAAQAGSRLTFNRWHRHAGFAVKTIRYQQTMPRNRSDLQLLEREAACRRRSINWYAGCTVFRVNADRTGASMAYRHAIGNTAYVFDDLRDLLAKASPPRSGDRLAGVAAESAEQMVAARIALADVPLKQFLTEAVIPYEACEVTRLIVDTHDPSAFAAISSLTVGSFRDWLLSDAATTSVLGKLARGITPEMAAAVSKLMRNQDLILVAKKCQVTTAFRNTIGLRGRT